MKNKHHRFFTFSKRAFSSTLLAHTFALLCLALLDVSTVSAQSDEAPLSATAEQSYQKELNRWMLQAYEGDRDAQFKVGVLFTNNQFNSADFEQAVYWYKQAARQGHALSQYNLGHQYLTGTGVKRSETEAMQWWLKAAAQDHPLAQFNVGRGYYLGIGLSEDHAQSEYWFKRAAKNNEPRSIELLEQLGWSETDEESTTNPTQNSITLKGAPIKPKESKESRANTDSYSIHAPETDSTSRTDNPIAVYTDPSKRAVLIAILDIRDDLEIVEQQTEWTLIQNKSGLPVWVHQDFITVDGSLAVIKGRHVNARSVPIISPDSIVGRLENGEKVSILSQQKQWYRVMSPSNFQAWVKTADLQKSTTENVSTRVKPSSEKKIAEKPSVITPTKTAPAEEPLSPKAIENTVTNNDNDWLFKQTTDSFTLQLASFSNRKQAKEFASHKKFNHDVNLRRFSASSESTTLIYFLYGSYSDEVSAKTAGDIMGYQQAWVRNVGNLQQNSCRAWKKQTPIPTTLNKYCL